VRILRLDLERFGIFEGRRIDLGDGSRLAIVHGDNERGKSTALDAVSCLLFGFPTRSRERAVGFDQAALAVGARIRLERGARREEDAEIRRTKRRDKTLEGTLVAGGDQIDDDWFHQRLGKPTRELFENVFGFTQAKLAQGEATLKKDVGAALYAAGFGAASDPQALLGELARRAEGLFKESGSKPRVNAALAALGEARRHTATIKPEELRRLEDELRERAAAAETLRAEALELRGRVARARALLAGIPSRRARDAAHAELATLHVPPAMTSRRGDEHRARLEARARLGREAEEARREIEALLRDLAGLAVDDAVLADDARIEALFRGVDAYRGAVAALPKREAELRALRDDAARRLASLGIDWDVDRLRSAPLDGAGRIELEQALGAAIAASAEIARLHDEARRAEARLAAMPAAAADAERVAAWLAGASGFDEARAQLRDARASVDALARRRDDLRRRLDPPLPIDGPDPLLVGAPPIEEVTRHRAALEASERRAARAAEQVDEKSEELARRTSELSAITAGGAAPSEAELVEARRARAAAWTAVRRALQTTKRSATADDAAAAFEEAQAGADAIVDRMRLHAEAVGRRESAEAARAQVAAELAARSSALGELEAKRAGVERAWTSLWSGTGIAPLAPAAMETWLRTRDALRDTTHELDAARGRLAEIAGRIAAYVSAGQAAFQAPECDVDVLRARAAQELKTTSERERERDAIRAVRERVARLEEGAARDAERSRRALASLGLAPDLTPAAASSILGALVDAHRALLGREGPLLGQAEEARDDVRRFEAAAGPVVGGDEPLDVGVVRLHAALVAARDAARSRDEWRRRLDAATPRATARERELDEVTAALAAARAAVGAKDDEAYLALAERAARSEALLREIDDADRALRIHRDAWDEGAYLEALATVDPGAVEAEIEAAVRSLAGVEAEVQRVDQQIGALRVGLQRMDGGGEAAEGRAREEALRAQITADAEEYAVLRVAQALLEDAVRRFERDHQPALLDGASRLFATMTGDRYRRIFRRMADSVLVVERIDGAELVYEQLSTGTREQLYLALRLAYIDHYREAAEALPVVLDDVLVNFDDRRAASTLEALAAFTSKAQVLVFTCHRHVVALARAARLDATYVDL